MGKLLFITPGFAKRYYLLTILIAMCLPGHVASAASFQQDHAAPEFVKVISDEEHASGSLQRNGSDVHQTVSFPLQQLIQLLFQEDLTHRDASTVISYFHAHVRPHVTHESSPC